MFLHVKYKLHVNAPTSFMMANSPATTDSVVVTRELPVTGNDRVDHLGISPE